MNILPIYSNELNEYEYEVDILYGKYEIENKFDFFIFFNAITDDKYPYMRITNNDHLEYTKSCRISLVEPKYLEVHDDPLDTWRFNDEEKIKFIKMLNSSAKEVLINTCHYIDTNITFWEYLLQSYDFQVDNKGDKCLVGRPMPDYNLL